VLVGSVTSKHTYDAGGNYLTKTTDPEGRTVDYTYDIVGNVKTEKVGTHTTSYDYDGLDRLTKVTDAKNGVTQYEYDANGNLTKIINARNKVTTYEYNELSQVKKVTDANNKSVTFDYDLNGNQTKITHPNGNTVEFGYNSVNRNTSVSYNGQQKYTFEYDPNGNLTKETDVSSGRVTTYTYDADNKVKSVQEPDGRTDYTYDKNGNVTQRKHTAGSTVITHDYAYNSLNQLTNIKANGTDHVWFTYNEIDQVASRKNGDGTTTLDNYNGAGDLVEQTIYDKNGNILDSFKYTYDAKGNITQVVSKAGTTTYVYDELDQLIKETRPDGTIYEYTYDATGNRLTKKVIQGGNVTTTTYTYDDADQLVSVNGTSYSYDANGNLISDGQRTYTYDAQNRLTSVKDSGGNTIASFTYYANGLRKTMTTTSGTITFHYDENNNVTYETDQNGNVVASYTYDDENRPVSMTRGGTLYFYQYNAHGDVVALTDTSGTVVATYTYDAFGNLLSSTGTVVNPYLYAGYRYDQETGLYYLQSRYYNPNTGRFLTRDTFGGFTKDPLSLHKYLYANNNPVMNIDPNGYYAKTLSWVVLRQLIGLWKLILYARIEISGNKITKIYKVWTNLSGFTFGIDWRQSAAEGEITNRGKELVVWCSGTIIGYVGYYGWQWYSRAVYVERYWWV
jgi:RHS repeat-associated protein